MQLFNYIYTSQEELENFIGKNILGNETILIQVFSGVLDISKLQDVLDVLVFQLPNSSIIGSSTAGEIVNGVMHEESIAISFSLFHSTTLRTIHYPKSDFHTGKEVAQNFLHRDTKAIITFSESIKNDAQLFLDGFSSIEHNVAIAGGNAGDNYNFMHTFLICDNKIYDDGIVICALDSESLNIHTDYSLEWKTIGNEMTVTHAKNNIIYEIDNVAVEELYKYYLGNDIVNNFPRSVIEFPLLKLEDGVSIARSIVAKNDSGGYIYAGHFKNGDKVKFSIGDIDTLLSNSPSLYDSIVTHPVEASFIYSCCVRKEFIGEELNYELGLIEKIAPCAGFFTYGEFYHSKNKNKLLNISTTTLSLSESNFVNKIEKIVPNKHRKSMLNSLVKLVNFSTKTLNQYKELLEVSSIVSISDLKGNIIYVNDEFCKISGYAKDELLGKNHSILKHPKTDRAIFHDMWKTITSKKIWKGTLKNLAKDGTTYHVKSTIMPILDDDGKIVKYIASRVDVSELVRKDEIIKKQYSDELTNLQNRASLSFELNYNSSHEITLILINIDRFSDINDYFGYEEGDKILKEFAQELKNRHEKVYRISGDEFAIICEHSFDEESKNALANMMTHLESNEYHLDKDTTSLFLSCGVSQGTKDEVYKNSYIALKHCKVSHEKIIIYNEHLELLEKIDSNIKVIAKIKQAIKDDRFVPFYQGIVDNKTRKIVKYESLIRLKEKNGDIISPYFFLEHAKKAKLYPQLTKIMIKKTFKKFANEPYEFSINLSLQDILSYKVVNTLMENLEKYRCGNRVVLEIVESEGIENFDELSVFIKQVKRYGCKIAIDDFGTGYSNFAYLSKLNIDFVKIDGSLIKDIDKDTTQLATVETIVFFTKKMKIKTIAEFVERESVFDVLVRLGIDFTQGYLFSQPKSELLEEC